MLAHHAGQRAPHPRARRRPRRARAQPRDDGGRVARAPLPPAREGPQVHRARATPAGSRPRRVHVRDASRDRRAWPRPGSATTCCSPTRSSIPTGWPGSRRSTRASPSRSTPRRPSTRPPRAGSREVLVDVNVGLPRCGCAPEDAGALADSARAGRTRGARRHGLRRSRRRTRRSRRARAPDGREHGAPRRGTCRRGWRRRLGRRHRHLRHQHVGHRDPGRLVRADGHRVRQARRCRSGTRSGRSRPSSP